MGGGISEPSPGRMLRFRRRRLDSERNIRQRNDGVQSADNGIVMSRTLCVCF